MIVLDAPVPGALARLAIEFGPALLLALVVGAMAAVMYATRRSGHWWGDDWALYLRQAKGLLDGHPNRVLTENEFTVFSSDGPEFSPPLYPWGFPLLLAPFVAVLGDNLDTLVIVPVLCACVFAVLLVRARQTPDRLPPCADRHPAVTLTPLLLSWSELIQSEWPFLAAAGVALVCLDRAAGIGRPRRSERSRCGRWCCSDWPPRRPSRCDAKGWRWSAPSASLSSLRWPRSHPRPWDLRGRPLTWLLSRDSHFRTPRSSLASVCCRCMLPSTVVPKYDGTSITNVWTLRGRLVRNLAQVVGPATALGQEPDGARLGDRRLDRPDRLPGAGRRRDRCWRCGDTARVTSTSPPTRSVHS